MKFNRVVAILFIYACTAIAWFTLGGTLITRTGQFDARLEREVEQLWGGRHVQLAPAASVAREIESIEDVVERNDKGETIKRQVRKTHIERAAAPLTQSRIDVKIDLDQRRKGLLWYDTYGVRFQSRYRVRNPDPVERPLIVSFAFPSRDAIYDDFVFRVDGHDAPPADDLSKTLLASTTLPANGECEVEIRYRSRGLGDWTYAFTESGVSQVRDFTLDLATDFAAIDFPAGTISPSDKKQTAEGWNLRWVFTSLAAGQRIGVDAPNRLNPGPVAARITFFAPVALLFFFTVLIVMGALRGQGLHPMNYFFLAAAFFAFHLLLAYLVDHVEMPTAFIVSSVVSIFLVASYLRVVNGMREDWPKAALAQFVYLVLFSYAFFFEGYTGLTVTIGAVVTLFVLMQVSARIQWGGLGELTNGRRQTAAGSSQ
jgi:hypothetical protein